MKSILLHINQDDGQESRLQFAIDLARATGAHIRCAQITSVELFVGVDPFGGVYAAGAVLDELREGERAIKTQVEAQLAREGVSWDWWQEDGPVVQSILSLGRLADAIVLSQPVKGVNSLNNPAQIVPDVAINARAPVFSVPVKSAAFVPAAPAMVAWNGSYEAAHALRLALPLLALSDSVHLIEVAEKSGDFPAAEAALYLSRHGIEPQIAQISSGEAGIGATLLGTARNLGAAYLVMGAYGHSRLRESILGGVTRDLIAAAPLPLLLAH